MTFDSADYSEFRPNLRPEVVGHFVIWIGGFPIELAWYRIPLSDRVDKNQHTNGNKTLYERN